MNGKLSIIVVDDHTAFRESLRQLIEAEPDFEVSAEAGNGQEAMELVRRLKPAVAILDMSMPPPDGMTVARMLRQENIPVGIILLTMFREESLFTGARELGVSYVLKDCVLTDLVDAIKAACRGEQYVSGLLNSYLLENDRATGAAVDRELMEDQVLRSLTPLERQVLGLIAEYKTTVDIAAELGIDPIAVEGLRIDISEKFGLSGTQHLMKVALRCISSSSQDA